jgi:hypothetical protein
LHFKGEVAGGWVWPGYMHSYFFASLSAHDLAAREWETIRLSGFEVEWNYYVT